MIAKSAPVLTSLSRGISIPRSPALQTPHRRYHDASGASFFNIAEMAWRSSGATNRDLIENLWRNDLIKDSKVKEAFLKVCFGHSRSLWDREDTLGPID